MFGSPQMVSVIFYGAAPMRSQYHNRAALQAAIADVDSRGRGVVVVPPEIDYGYKRGIPSTYPDFSSARHDILIHDYSINTRYDSCNGDGMQYRIITKTHNETAGKNDGNTQWLNGNWHPAFMLMHEGENTNNRRATYFTGIKGEVAWGVGQGINTAGVSSGVSKGASDDELAHFKIIGNKVAGGRGLETMLAINKTNGYWGFGGMANPDKEFHFKTKRGCKGEVKFESHTDNLEISLSTPNKMRKWTIRDDNGSLNITDLNGTSNVVTFTDSGEVIAKDGININVARLPKNPTAGRMVFYKGELKLYTGCEWRTI